MPKVEKDPEDTIAELLFQDVINITSTRSVKFCLDLQKITSEKRGYNINYRFKKCSLLHHAIRYDRPIAVSKILEIEGVDVNIQDVDGNTPLHLIAKKRSKFSLKSVNMLVSNGANASIVNFSGKTVYDLLKDQDPSKAAKFLKLLPEANTSFPYLEKDYAPIKQDGDLQFSTVLTVTNKNTRKPEEIEEDDDVNPSDLIIPEGFNISIFVNYINYIEDNFKIPLTKIGISIACECVSKFNEKYIEGNKSIDNSLNKNIDFEIINSLCRISTSQNEMLTIQMGKYNTQIYNIFTNMENFLNSQEAVMPLEIRKKAINYKLLLQDQTLTYTKNFYNDFIEYYYKPLSPEIIELFDIKNLSTIEASNKALIKFNVCLKNSTKNLIIKIYSDTVANLKLKSMKICDDNNVLLADVSSSICSDFISKETNLSKGEIDEVFVTGENSNL